ncbi:MAG TPA: hypothetical protein VHH91_08150, partial [Vicinamibacterales bacterium]|nr:hypothetical protein [Vicinamibacterales bacterium]
MRVQFRPGARVAAAALSMLLTAASVFGQPAQQTPQPPLPPAPAPTTTAPPQQQAAPPAAAGPVRQLTVDDAVRLALEQNLGVQVER